MKISDRLRYAARLHRNIMRVAFAWVPVLCAVSLSAQTTWYVATNGTDSASLPWGTDRDHPFDTIGYAVGRSASLDTILVGPGEYVLTASITIPVTKDIHLVGEAGREATIINGNYPTSQIRALYALNGRIGGFTITNAVRNSANNGGGVYLDHATMTNCTISGNRLYANYGGGVAVFAGGVLSNCIVRGNHVLATGGGVNVWGGGEVWNCLITDNTSDSVGGGCSVYAGGLVMNSVLSNNTSLGNGGGASLSVSFGVDAAIKNSIVVGNRANGPQGGGGLYLYRGGSVWNSLIYNNVAVSYEGGGIYLARAGTIASCTVISNAAMGNGGGLYTIAGAATDIWMRVNNTIIASNAAPTGADLRQAKSGGMSAWFTNNCIFATDGGSLAGVNNLLATDPLFADPNPADPNYRLQRRSPCINTGTNMTWMLGIGAVDLDRRPRLDAFSGLADMGCYESLAAGTLFLVR